MTIEIGMLKLFLAVRRVSSSGVRGRRLIYYEVLVG